METPHPNWEVPTGNLPPPSSSVALRCCRWTTAKSWDPRWVALGPWGSSGFLWLVTWVAEDVYTIYKWNKPRIGDLRSPGSFILCVSQLRWSSIIANPWHFSCWTWWTMGFWVDSFGGLNLQKTVVSTSGKKGFLVNLHLPFIQFWLGIRARYLKSILLVKPWFLLGIPHFEKHPMGISLASFGESWKLGICPCRFQPSNGDESRSKGLEYV